MYNEISCSKYFKSNSFDKLQCFNQTVHFEREDKKRRRVLFASIGFYKNSIKNRVMNEMEWEYEIFMKNDELVHCISLP